MTNFQGVMINNRQISNSAKPYVVAELSGNHNGSLESAKQLIKQAKICGADAVKLQTYTADMLTVPSDSEEFLIKTGLWAGKRLYDLYEWAHTPIEWTEELFSFARSQDITIFSSPFSEEAIDLLESVDCPAYKIASFEANDHALIEYAASTGKPLVISTGLLSLKEIADAVDTATKASCRELILLHCVSGYPAPVSDFNLRTITDMQSEFDCLIGLSDHSLTNTAATAAVSLGACFIEKHFTLDRNSGGPDASFSMEPQDLRSLRESCDEAHESLGEVNYNLKGSEKDNIIFQRSLYFVANLDEGVEIRKEHVRSIRPGFGIEPKFLDDVIGKTTSRQIDIYTPVSMDLLV